MNNYYNNNVYLVKFLYQQEPIKCAVQIICNIIIPKYYVLAILNSCVYRTNFQFSRDNAILISADEFLIYTRSQKYSDDISWTYL